MYTYIKYYQYFKTVLYTPKFKLVFFEIRHLLDLKKN